ncbi:MAG: DUF362 domain-containing protein [Desulfomonile tiedjei]|uniref:DUF362 domain-containing protein n=1 Tax=Desulfomonile tiedjei TaxID=2358 RepID=A0A9D6Z659_9BACT|nr:DUF362 domain-containing protein [Desulfomonile tiedjei]
MKSLVSIRKCENYDSLPLGSAMESVLADLGGIAAFVRPGDKVLLKPNLLKAAGPSEAVVTHPALVEAVASMVIDAGGSVFIGDSPPLGNLARVLAKSGYDPFMKRLGLTPAPFLEKLRVEFPEGRLFRCMDLSREIFEFDTVINLAKLKTHTQMVLTLAVKNLFGSVIGTDKASWHMRAGRDFDTFATALVQIYDKIRPALSIVDGILAMEGNGPNSGDPRPVGIIGASTDAVALDAVICALLGFDTDVLRTCVIAHEHGIGMADFAHIRVVGDELHGFPLRDFKLPKSVTVTWNFSHWNPIRRFMENHVITKPRIDSAECLNCGICASHCPPGAISEEDGAMVIDRKKCISCFCCHELCSNRAVRIVQPFFGKFLSLISR